MYAIGAEFSSTVISAVFIGFFVTVQLSYSWMQMALSALLIFTHHGILVVLAMTRIFPKDNRVHRLDGLESYRAKGSQTLEAVIVLAILLRATFVVILMSRLDERETREDYIVDARTRHRRNVSQRVVESMVPGPVANEMRACMARGLPPSMSWKFDMTCILQSDIVGFTRRVQENRIRFLTSVGHERHTRDNLILPPLFFSYT